MKTAFTTQHNAASTLNGSHAAHNVYSPLRRLSVLVALLMTFALGVRAQNYYVFRNSYGYYIYNNNGSVGATDTFSPACVWIASGSLGGTSQSLQSYVDNSDYLRGSASSLSIGDSQTNWRTGVSNGNNYLRYYGSSSSNRRYIGYQNSAFTFNSSINTTRDFAAYPVTVSTVATTSTPPTINGNDVLTASGNYTYTATDGAYQVGGYTQYSFNSMTYNFNSNNTTITPVAATLGTKTWSITNNNYATINSSTGVVTVNSIPASDITLTITATVAVTGGTPAVPANTTIVGTKEITIQGSVPAAPTISVSGTTVTLQTDATGTTSIRYTIDGTDPTATTGKVYSGAFDISGSTNSPVTIKAITVRNGNASSVTTQQAKLTLPEPVITVNAATGTATITCSNSSATIYYTTDGSAPSATNGTQYNGQITGLVTMATVKAIAICDGWNSSSVASATVTIPSGVSSDGTTVTLFDYEDHKWSYYSDEECPIHSLNPADVKITYYGNGTKTVTTTNDDNPTSFTADATGVKVGIDADANTFVYYKTLERMDGSTAATPSAATGRCAYTTIPNPFSVRPTYGSGDTRWRGFYKWRVKKVSGGTIHSASTGGATYAQGSTINAEEEIYFAPSSEYGMEVEFEALWARAYVVTTNATSGLKSSVSYERNFVYLSTNTTLRNAALSYPVTYTTLDPSTGNGTKCTITIRDGFTCNANTKFENLTFAQYNNNAQTLTANGHDLIVGRGCSGTVNYVRGISGNITNPNYTIRLESGTYNYFSALRGYQAKGGSNGTDTGSSMGGTPSIKVIFGCDYDRATNTGITDNLAITNGAYYGYSVSEGNNITYSETAFYAIVKSGKIGKGFTIDNSYAAKADGAFYIGIAGERVRGCRNLLIEGGQIASIAGGIDNIANQDKNSIKIRMKGGHVRGVVYGGGARSAAYGNRSLIFTGGTVTGWIGGGCNGEPMSAGQSEDTYGGITHGTSCVYFGGNAICGGEGSDVSINGSIGGIVFGAGKGVEGNTTSGRMANGTTVAIADNCNVQRDVYGGGNFGYAQTSTNIFVGGGTVQGGVFGGSNKNNGPVVSILMKDGTIEGGVYGGSNDTGTISNNVTMQINGGQVGTSSKPANIHGGGYGNSTTVSGNVNMTIGESTSATDWVKVYGNVYGGSALGTVSGNTAITMNKGEINGNLFGGALGNDTYAAQVNGNVEVTVNGGKVTGAVFGCNDANGTPKGTVSVTINGTDATTYDGSGNRIYALQGVYGGGNLAHYNPTTATNGYPKVVVNKCLTSIKEVYGGGNAAAVPQTDVTIYGGDIGSVFAGGNGISGTPANVGYQNKLEPTTDNSYGNGTATARIYGGTIGRVFGGSNAHGVIREGVSVNIDKSQSTANPKCDMIVGEVYGGGNMADSKAASVTIGCTGTLTESHRTHPEDIGVSLEGIGSVFGGANQADVTSGNITVNINSGIVANVFGGNNQTGAISGTIAVNIEKTSESDDDCGWYVGNVFGGGNLAQYTGNPAVNILNGEVSGNVYGGGKGDANDHSKGQVTGNPQVTIGDNNTAHTAIVAGDVYGGGDAGDVVGTPLVHVVDDCNTQIGNVYGGGNAADVSATSVTIDGGTISGMVFGGGHGNKDAEPQTEANVTGDVNVLVTGGTINKVFGGSNSKGNIGGDINLTIEKADGHCDMHITEVYGGGNEAAGNAGTITIGCTGGEGEGIGDVYGGANAANINTPITLNITGGNISRVFGGNNASGSINGDIQVNVDWTGTCGVNALGNVYGAGNQAAYSGNTEVNILNGTVTGSVYGGGLGATAVVTGTTTVNIDGSAEGHSVAVTQNVLGGGDAAAVKGSTDVNIINGAISGSVFGGGNAAGVSENGVVDVTGGTIASGVYGGSNASGTVGNTTVTIAADGIIGTDAAHANVHGGGYGEDTEVSGNVAVNIQGGTIYGDVYGGSALGYVNGTTATDTYHTHVTMNKGTIYGSLYGGALGSNTVAANVYGPVEVKVHGGSVKATSAAGSGGVYGANNINGAPQRSVTVDIYGTDPAPEENQYALHAVYGGGNQAPYTYGNGYPKVTVHNCNNSIEYVYGGGNAAAVAATDVTIYGGDVIGNVFGGGNGTVSAANVNGNATTKIHGGTILNVYGGSNSQGTIGGTINVTVNSQAENSGDTPCTMNIGSVYGGGNLAASEEGNLTITCTGTDGRIDNVYGGANQANITGDIDLKINGGNIGNVFGGNNIKGDISGNITVTVGNDPNDCGVFQIDNVYGAGNLAPYGSESVTKGYYPVVNIYSGTVTNNVYGGGLGESAIVYGNPQVTIGDAVAEHTAIVGGDVYGGGDAADVKGTPVVKVVNDCNTKIGNVYGGGNAADVSATNVTIDGGTITGMVFGGGHGNKDAEPQTEANVNGDVNVDITGGTINKVFGGSNSKGNITGTIAMNIEKGDESCEMHITEVYGGGNEAAGNAGTITIGCTGGEGEGIGDVYGGANAADINTPITLNITGGNISRVFGGNNTSGAIKGDIQVNVDWTGTCGINALGNVYGAGNQAAYTGNTQVNILNGTVTGSVYGGGLGATAVVTGTTTVNIDGSAEGHSVAVTQNVLGGGDAAAVEGSTDVNIINGAISGSVFGGGNAAGVSENGVVDVTGGTIASGVYGGSNASGTVGNTTVTIAANGTIGTDAAHANVHGGGYGEDTEVSGNVAVNIQGGTIYGDVYGGSALGTVNTDANNTTAVNLTGGLVHGDAYGGGLGDSDTAADVNGNVTVTLDGTAFTLATTKDNENNIIPTSGRVFGCNNINGSPKGTVLVQVLQTVARNSDGTLKDKPEIGSGVYELQAVYGGGNLAAYKPANPKANGQFTSYTWGEKNVAHVNTNKPVQVVIDGCGKTSIEYVYGGGNAAATPATDVTVLGSYEIGSVFGGGNGKDRYTLDGGTTWNENLGADVGIINAAAYATDKSQGRYGTGNAMTSVLGGTVHNIFGGSNTLGNIVGEAIAYLDAASDCDLNVDGIYGGGNEAYMDGSSGIQLGCITYLKEIYGGARNANVGGDINLTITSGHFDRVFGGNNLGGAINGSITVNIEETGCNPITIGELYGCGNKAAYTTPSGEQHPTINIRSFTGIGNVFGGGLGEEAVVTGNPTININVVKGVNNAVEVWSHNGETINFGDGSTVTLPLHETGKIGAIGNVFGGGNAAAVIGNTQVNIGTATSVVFESLTGAERTKTVEGVDIRGNVYGGGNQADVSGTTDVKIGAQQ